MSKGWLGISDCLVTELFEVSFNSLEMCNPAFHVFSIEMSSEIVVEVAFLIKKQQAGRQAGRQLVR